jgi:hypothetical protein
MRNQRKLLVLNKETLRALGQGRAPADHDPLSGCTQRDNTCTTKREMICMK